MSAIAGRASFAALFTSLAFAAAIAAQPPAQSRPPIVIEVVGRVSPDHTRGLNMAAREADTAAQLIGRPLRIVRAGSSPPDASPAGVIAGAGAGRRALGPRVPIIWLDRLPASRRPCDLSTMAPAGTPRGHLLWDHSLTRFGATQLNDRFRREHASGMTSEAWSAWFAVKALAEVALTEAKDLCEALTTRRFDGHKGVALRFDAETGRLPQPVYLVEQDAQGRRVVKEIR